MDLLETLHDFTSKENWDKFFTLRGAGDSFEWYADWPELRRPLLDLLRPDPNPDPQILVPGCGSSRLSEYLYDAGFRRITNVDFSKVVVSDMLRRYVRSRPEMKWRVMDMTQLQFEDEFFDVTLDKGGLDALMEPEHGAELGSKYLTEVKRVLRSGGKFILLTLAESHVLGTLFSELRFGWDTSILSIPHKPSSKPSFQTFMVVSAKGEVGMPYPIKILFDESMVNYKGKQVQALINSVENENKVRIDYKSGAEVLLSLKDMLIEPVGDLKELLPGRRCQFILGEKGSSVYHYKSVLLDSKTHSEPFVYHCGVFIVPKARTQEWLFTSEEGQWVIVESSKSARLIMVFLDSTHLYASMEDIQKDLSPLIKKLAPREAVADQIPFMMASDGVKQKNVVHEVSSTITGPIVVEDVIYDYIDGDAKPSDRKMFRRLTFGRSSALVQSEALLLQDQNVNLADASGKKNALSKPKKKGSKKRNDSSKYIDGCNLKVDHSCLASQYHSGILSGFALVISALQLVISSGREIRTYIVGLGAGLLPMFLHGCLPFLQVEVIELDPLVVDLARKYFGFVEDERLRVHVGDGIQFVQDANVDPSSQTTNPAKTSTLDEHACNVLSTSTANGNDSFGIKILIVDADSADLSSGLSCPPSDFVEESFLLAVRDFLSPGGLFIINLVSRSLAIREKIVSRLNVVFTQLFSIELEEDVNEILFASPTNICVNVDKFPEAIKELQKMMKFPVPDGHLESLKIKCLK